MDDKVFNRVMTADAYVAEVRKTIANLDRSKVGHAVLETIKLWKRGVRITPPRVNSADVCGAEISDTVPMDQRTLDYNTKTLPFVRKVNPAAPFYKAVVHFIPRMDLAIPKCKAFVDNTKKVDFVPTLEEVLVHEWYTP